MAAGSGPGGAAGGAGGAKPQGPASMLMLVAFMVVIFILFSPGIRDSLGHAVGVVLWPAIGFGSKHPVWTLFFAGLIMVTGSTVLRHYLVDWVSVARAQEYMKVFQREFKEARKSNNTYKIKKLTDLQPELMQMQAKVSTQQMKPMAFTMILIIPIFAWMFAYTTVPIAYDVGLEGADAVGVVLIEDRTDAADRIHVHVLTAPGRVQELTGTTAAYILPLPDAGAGGAMVTFQDTTRGRGTVDVVLDDDALLPMDRFLELGSAPEGVLSVRVEGSLRTSAGKVSSVLLLVQGNGTVDLFTVGAKKAADIVLEEPSTIFATVPVRGDVGDDPGHIVVTVTGLAEKTLRGAHALPLHDVAGEAALYPHAVETPWNPSYDLNENWWFLPRWILLYSLFSIPFGQVLQKALKQLEYRRATRRGTAEGAAP